jgi:F0F1-type ATP synthase delta subunit
MKPFSIIYANSLFSLADEEQKSETVLNDMKTVYEPGISKFEMN